MRSVGREEGEDVSERKLTGGRLQGHKGKGSWGPGPLLPWHGGMEKKSRRCVRGLSRRTLREFLGTLILLFYQRASWVLCQ